MGDRPHASSGEILRASLWNSLYIEIKKQAQARLGLTSAFAEVVMSDPIEALILDLLEWLAPQPRAYSEVMDAWRTSCPRLPVWEEANDREFVRRGHSTGLGPFVALTPLGREHLAKHRGT
jgi:hypothetical protein